MNDVYIFYSDFNCPFCYAMHQRLSDMKLLDRCAWRGVQHAPHLSIPMVSWHGALADELRHEVMLVQRLAPGLPIVVPSGKPNTERTIAWAASLLRQDASRGMAFIRQSYRAFWCEGQDLSDPAVLAHLAQAVQGQCVLTDRDKTARQFMTQWDEEWRSSGLSGVPLLVAPDGRQVVGLAAESDILTLFQLGRGPTAR